VLRKRGSTLTCSTGGCGGSRPLKINRPQEAVPYEVAQLAAHRLTRLERDGFTELAATAHRSAVRDVRLTLRPHENPQLVPCKSDAI
jgi:hypothetical protein